MWVFRYKGINHGKLTGLRRRMRECFLGINLYNHLNCRSTTAVEEVKHLGRSEVHRVGYKKDVLTECWSRMDATQSSACELLYEYTVPSFPSCTQLQ